MLDEILVVQKTCTGTFNYTNWRFYYLEMETFNKEIKNPSDHQK